jgi:hypothetical protein
MATYTSAPARKKKKAASSLSQKAAVKLAKKLSPGTVTAAEMKAMMGAAPKTRKAVMKAKKRK